MTQAEKWEKLIEWIEGLATDPEKIMTILMHWVRANDIDHEDPPEEMFSPEAFRENRDEELYEELMTTQRAEREIYRANLKQFVKGL